MNSLGFANVADFGDGVRIIIETKCYAVTLWGGNASMERVIEKGFDAEKTTDRDGLRFKYLWFFWSISSLLVLEAVTDASGAKKLRPISLFHTDAEHWLDDHEMYYSQRIVASFRSYLVEPWASGPESLRINNLREVPVPSKLWPPSKTADQVRVTKIDPKEGTIEVGEQ